MIEILEDKKKKNKEIDENLLFQLKRIDVDFTIKVLRVEHQDFNQLLGNLIPTQVLGKLKHEIFNGNYKVSIKENGGNGKGLERKKLFARFMLNASRFNRIDLDDEDMKIIDMELDSKCIIPIELIKLFKIDIVDIEYYVREKFLPSGYYRYFHVWDVLSKEDINKDKNGSGKYHEMYINNRI